MLTITWEELQKLAAELGATVTRKKKFLSNARQVMVTSPSEKEWHSGYHKNDKDLSLAFAYLAGVKKWQDIRNAANPIDLVTRASTPRRMNRDRADVQHNPNRDTHSLAVLQSQLAHGSNSGD